MTDQTKNPAGLEQSDLAGMPEPELPRDKIRKIGRKKPSQQRQGKLMNLDKIRPGNLPEDQEKMF